MKILIAGGGKVGAALTRHLSGEDHDLTIIDTNKRVLSERSDIYDVRTLQGTCACLATLRDAGAAEAELLIAATNEAMRKADDAMEQAMGAFKSGLNLPF